MSNTHRLTVAETERLQRGLETLAGMLDTHYGLRQRTDIPPVTVTAEQCYYNGLVAALEALGGEWKRDDPGPAAHGVEVVKDGDRRFQVVGCHDHVVRCRFWFAGAHSFPAASSTRWPVRSK